MLDKQQASQLVVDKLQELFGGTNKDIIIDERKTIEKMFGWIFSYNTRQFIDLGDHKYKLVGSGPVIVNKYDHAIHLCGPLDVMNNFVEKYERDWNDRNK